MFSWKSFLVKKSNSSARLSLMAELLRKIIKEDFPLKEQKHCPGKEPWPRPEFNLEDEPEELIKENSSYISGGKCAPNNNPFWEDGANPLSSKGN